MDGVRGSHSNTQLVTKIEHEDDDFKIRGAASSAMSNEATAKDLTPDTCTICLQTITERAVAVPCNHLTFDYLCLVSWLQERATCPLCKAVVREVQYDFGGPADYKTYRLPLDAVPGNVNSDNERPTGREGKALSKPQTRPSKDDKESTAIAHTLNTSAQTPHHNIATSHHHRSPSPSPYKAGPELSCGENCKSSPSWTAKAYTGEVEDTI
ncbi:hypothetical protein LTR78_002838 [Recurvomyces mirabilis]|uniref:RING-type E3 ubiquitin transferase n=1 Tax=Recurvomyces mirabilis TaxID=574656 RepID=A0AAE0WT42_9PEZI|nr:hypothetical protein LTR78_002838 [Recurvomyces mirabilis]KAK5159429.1 hypothetical protein LTS14_002571 [Recurvomyces mirabilis]